MLTDTELIVQFVNDSRLLLIESQSQKGIRASGKSAAELGVNFGNQFGQLIDKAGYFYFQEFGRKAGKSPPFKAIYDWMEFQKYGLTYTNEKERVALTFALMHSIRKKGTYTHRHGSTNVVSDVVTPERVTAFAQSFANKYKSTVLSDIAEAFKPGN